MVYFDRKARIWTDIKPKIITAKEIEAITGKTKISINEHFVEIGKTLTSEQKTDLEKIL